MKLHTVNNSEISPSTTKGAIGYEKTNKLFRLNYKAEDIRQQTTSPTPKRKGGQARFAGKPSVDAL